MRRIATLILLLLTGTAYAEWPAELGFPGVALGYPCIGSDGHNGAFVAGSGFAFDDWDTFLFHVDSTGQSLWMPADSAWFIGPGDQYPLELHADGTGGCVLLVDEELNVFPGPSRHRVQVVRYDSSGHKVWQFMPYDTTWEDLHGYNALAITDSVVTVVWWSNVPDSGATWYTRLRLSDGVVVDSPSNGFLTYRIVLATYQRDDSLFFATTGDSLFVLDLAGANVSYRGCWQTIPWPQMLMMGDTILFLGTNSNSRLYLFEYSIGESFCQIDTLSHLPPASYSIGYCAAVTGDKVIICYQRCDSANADFDLRGRVFSADSGLTDEIVICDVSGDQYFPEFAKGSQGVGLTWFDTRNDTDHIYIQHFENGQARWTNGHYLESQSAVFPVVFIDACEGNSYGLVAYSDIGYIIVQPIDSLVTDAITPPRAMLPAKFKLEAPFPNPFNGSLRINFTIALPAHITLTLYNLLGQKVEVLAKGPYSAGEHHILWKSGVASGVYLLRLDTPWGQQIQKIVALK